MKELNYERVFNILVKETSNYITRNRLNAMVLGISGGIDSTVVAAICHEVSKQTGIPLIGRSLPIKNKEDEFDVSKLVGEAFCNDFKVVNLTDGYLAVYNSIIGGEENLISCGDDAESKYQTPIANGNIQARLRMIYLYNLASIHKGLVMSTDNQTEYQLGFWTIHGDVGDFDPIQGLWKTEVYELAKWLIGYYYGCGIKKEVDADGARKICDMCEAIKKSISLTPTDGLGISNSDLDQIGAKSYYDVDRVLQTLTCKASPENDKLQDELTAELGPDVVGKITERRFKSRFKRLVSPIIVPREMYD
jgi:NAD+ synthetase